MERKNDRMGRERKTMEAMIGIYCRGNHDGAGMQLCADCMRLMEYAYQRLDRCPFKENKTTCAKCPVHCYKPDMRQQVKGVMRYAGPRMTYRHPVLALFHFLDGFRKNQQRLSRQK